MSMFQSQPDDLSALLRRAGRAPDRQSAEEAARRAGGTVSGNMVRTATPAGNRRIPTYTPLSMFESRSGLTNQLDAAIISDWERSQAQENDQFGRTSAIADQVGGAISGGRDRLLGAFTQGSRPLEGVLGDIDREMDASRGFRPNDILRRMDQGLSETAGMRDRALTQAGFAEQTMGNAMNQMRDRTIQDEAQQVGGIYQEALATSRQVEADPNLTYEQKTALKHQIREQVRPSIERTVSENLTNMRNVLAQMGTQLAGLQSQHATLRGQLASDQQQGVVARAGVATELASQDQRRAELRANYLQMKSGIAQVLQSMRYAAEAAAIDLEVQGRLALGQYVSANPYSPVSYASAVAAMMSTRSMPGAQNFRPVQA